MVLRLSPIYRVLAFVCVCLAASHSSVAQETPAPDASAQALIEAQRRLRAADDELKRARGTFRKAEAKAQDAQAAYEAAQRRLEETRTSLERAKQDVEGSKAGADEAQRHYDSARAVIEQIYQVRQTPAR